MKLKTALTIAGSDCSGGAGIQADLKTMTMNGVYAMSAITALTAQNTTGVRAIQESTPDFLKQQIDSIFEDIYPDAVKIGMVATSGSSLMKNDAVQTLIEELFPISTLVTPNVPEAEILSGLTIETKEDMMEAAKQIGDHYHCAVLLKGGHSIHDANDLLYANGELIWFEGKRIDNPNTHGTGCALSSAIASNLAKGIQQTICMGAPFYVLGPIVTDIAPGYDHITAAIGGAIAAASGAAFLCYVTPAEHLALPNVADVKQGIIASRIAAHAADIAKKVPHARDVDDAMADARRTFDWEKQWECSIDPETAKAIRDSRAPEHEDSCSMCGKFCAVRSMNKALNGEYIDIL